MVRSMPRRDLLKGLAATAGGILIPELMVKKPPPVIFDLGRKVDRRIWTPRVVCYDIHGKVIKELETHVPSGPHDVIATFAPREAFEFRSWGIVDHRGNHVIRGTSQYNRLIPGDMIRFCCPKELYANA
jgi:hypothetical protein